MKSEKGNAVNQLLLGLAVLLVLSVLAMTGIGAVIYHGMKVEAMRESEAAKNSLLVPAPVYPEGRPTIHLE